MAAELVRPSVAVRGGVVEYDLGDEGIIRREGGEFVALVFMLDFS